MMINTSKFSKCLIIFLVYNIMIIFTVSGSDSDTDDTENKIVPDFDVIRKKDNNDYFKYYFRSCNHDGQLKIRPKTFFKSVYNCDYMILPELHDKNDYDAYKEKMEKLNEVFESIEKKYNKFYTDIKKQEDLFVQKFEKSYEVTEKAYEVIEYENLTSYRQLFQTKPNREAAINDYKENQMPDISKTTFPEAYWDKYIRYIYKNYEVYADPTDEVYYRSNILQEEYNAVMDGNEIKTCKIFLTKEEYAEVQFLYEFISTILFDQNNIKTTKFEIFLELQNTLPNLTEIHPKEDLMGEDKHEESLYTYQSTRSKLESEFVVNHENYMSYLVRMKILEKIPFHLDYHQFMYKTREDYKPVSDQTNITLNAINTEVNPNSGRLQSVALPIGRRTIIMDIHKTTSRQFYAELKPFDPEDII